jgi:hypothetical protein
MERVEHVGVGERGSTPSRTKRTRQCKLLLSHTPTHHCFVNVLLDVDDHYSPLGHCQLILFLTPTDTVFQHD